MIYMQNTWKGNFTSEIKQRLDTVYKDFPPALITVQNWCNERGQTFVFKSHV